MPDYGSPMRIKALEIAGFKSFYLKTKIDFSEGITAIVGPNGCGKSNILDAIRWVVGEHNPRQLRAGGMEDVISNGSAELKPLGMADVSMVLEGVEGFSFEEVRIRRKLYRSGESEYSINGVKCRLKDITEMLLDTGMGARAYSIVEQGQIESFIMSKPEEKRKFIEEVAGIEKYKLRRKETRSRIESTKENLSRVLDMKREVSDRIEAVALQAKRARQYGELTGRARSLEFDVLSAKLENSEKRRKTLLEKKLGAEELVLSADSGKEEKHGLLQSAREKNSVSGQQLGSLEKEIYELRAQKKENEYRRTSIEREIAGISSYVKDIEAEIESLGHEISDMEEKSSHAERRSGELKNTRLSASEEISREEENLALLKSEWEHSKKELDETGNHLSDVMTRRSSIGSTIGAFSKELEELAEKKEALDGEAEALGLEKLDCEQKLASLRRLEGEIKSEFTSAAKEKEEIDSRLYDLRVEHEKKLGELRALEGRKKDCVSRTEALNRIQSNYEWLPDATRKFVVERKQRGVLGVVSDFVSVPRNYERAVEAAFGEKLNWIVVEGSTEAVAAVELLREFDAGRGTFIPATDRFAARNGASNGHGKPDATSLNSLLDVKTIGKTLVDSMLQEVYVTSDLREAIKLKNRTGNGACFATLEGDYVDSHGAITGGKSSAGVFERKREIEELEEQTRVLSAHIEESEAACKALREEMDKLESRRTQVEELLRRCEISSVENVKDLSNVEARIEELGTRIGNLSAQREDLERKLGSKNRTVGEMESLIEQLDGERSALESKYEEIEERALAFADEENALQENITKLRIDNAGVLEREKALENEKSEAERIKAVINEKLLLRKKDVELKKGEWEALALSRRESEEEFEKISRDLDSREESFGELEKKVSRYAEELRRCEEEFEAASGELSSRREQFASAQAQLDRAEDEFEYLNERYNTVFGDDLPDTFRERDLSAVSIPEGERELKTLRRRIENFGPVNLLAPEEYEQLEERNGFLQRQTDDLARALDYLESAIRKLDRESVSRFREAFETVNRKFSDTFCKLFENGEGRLELVDPTNLLETGVEVMIRPGGKRFQPINLLSGGEKALSAIAVIISACLVKPVPFVFLDEIDAALDEVNTVRFCKILNEISVHSQVAVITHNRRTMHEAGALIGITTDGTAASRVVSVKLDA
jgi:chromosome segregation protein